MKYTLKHEKPLPLEDNNFLHTILTLRGIGNPTAYLHPTESELIDPSFLDNIDIGAELLQKHLKNKSKIFLQVDSDCDGYCSAAYIWLYIKSIAPDIKIQVHVHDIKHHGIKVQDVPEDINLVIITDAGSNQFEEHKLLTEMGIDVLVLDHHPVEEYSEHAVVINNQPSKNYSNKALCGTAICYKFACYYDKKYKYNFANNHLDLIATALVADSMDLRPLETRYLTKIGLSDITCPFLVTALKKNDPNQSFSPLDISFNVAPFINAIIRVGSTEHKNMLFEAFVDGNKKIPSTKRGAEEGDVETKAQAAYRIATNCRNRQNAIIERAVAKIEVDIEKYDRLSNVVLFIPLEDDDVPSSLTGLIAMKLAEKYGRPSIVARLDEETNCWKGSMRGLDLSEIDDFKDVIQTTDLFEFVEGHPNAAGIMVRDANVAKFLRRTNESLSHINLYGENHYLVDYILNVNTFFKPLVIGLGAEKIWGKGIENPLLVIEKIPLWRHQITSMGANSMKFKWNGITYVALKNSQACEDFQEYEAMEVDICGECNINEWNGIKIPQVIIRGYNIRPY